MNYYEISKLLPDLSALYHVMDCRLASREIKYGLYCVRQAQNICGDTYNRTRAGKVNR